MPLVIVLTVAAAEPSGASLGAVFIDPVYGSYEYFGKMISQLMVREWQNNSRTRVICQAEMVAVPLALSSWAEAVEGRAHHRIRGQ